jgi:DNA mismatch repair protein MutS
MQQHGRAKADYPNALVFFRLGDFYEMFGEDAVVGARVLDIALTSRNKGAADEIPMAGVPAHSAAGYIGKLLAAGYQVAICEQMADPKTTKGIVPRDVVRVLSPGLVTNDDHLVASENNWLAGITVGLSEASIALLDVSTGELRQATLGGLTGLLAQLAQAAPREVLIASGDDAERTAEALRVVLPSAAIRVDAELGDAERARVLGSLLGEAERNGREASDAVARVLREARRCIPDKELPIVSIGQWDPKSELSIDENAQRHLELVSSNSRNPKATLLGTLAETRTAAGARLLRRRLLAPLCRVEPIRRRHDRVQAFVTHAAVRAGFREHLELVCDFERILSRCQLGEGSPRDLGQLRTGLLAAAAGVALLDSLTEPDAREALQLLEPIDVVSELAANLERALVDRPPAQAKEGAIFRSGYDPQLDELQELRTQGNDLIVALETRLREETSIGNLRVRFTRVFGWYIEVTRSSAGKVPGQWRRKQTVAGGERFTLPELDDLAERIASAEDTHRARELELLRGLVSLVVVATRRIRALAIRLSEWDVDAALAEIAHRHDYSRPIVEDGSELVIEEGRHPVVERLAAAGRFVPNDVSLDYEKERLWILTGPNMAGKSTFLRQVALITILAQMGSFVPAKHARIGLCDRVLSRVGASDNLAEGQSTFMVEMKETADILRLATKKSLVILDEIGRGTSTFDGLAIAWAVAEHLDQVCGCRALFATHYHELTRLAEESAHVRNHSVSARERDGDIVFLHRLVQGAASRSYGVSVAKLAGLPEVVLARARALLAMLEGEVVDEHEPITRTKPRRGKNDGQLGLFGAAVAPRGVTPTEGREVLDTLRTVDVERLTPLEALQLIVKLKKRL